jgi:hypothetical protein
MGLFEDLLNCLEDLRKLYEQKQSIRVEKKNFTILLILRIISTKMLSSNISWLRLCMQFKCKRTLFS